MRIVMIGQKGIPAVYGGVERHVEDLTKELVKRGHEVLVYARNWYSPNVPKNYSGARVILTPSIRTKHLDAITHTLASTIHALFQKPDVLHYHGVGPSLLSFIPRLLLPRAKVISTFHCIDRYHQKWGAFAKLILRLGEWAACNFPHETISVSRIIQNYCLNEYQRPAAHVANGVSRGANIPDPAILSGWNLKPRKYILMVSRLVRHKGAHTLMNAWQYARKQYPELLKDYKLVIAGGSSFTDKYARQLRRAAQEDESVVFTGWQSGESLAGLYAYAAFLTHPSENEGSPITVLQAMAFGRPALVSDIPEHKEIISDSRFWFPVNNLSSLADKIVELLKNPEMLERAGAANRRIVFEKYDWEKLADDVVEIYEKKIPSNLLRYSLGA